MFSKSAIFYKTLSSIAAETLSAKKSAWRLQPQAIVL